MFNISFDVNIKTLAGASTADLVYEVVPDSTVTTPSTRVCRAEVTKIGSNLPCIQVSISPTIYEQTFCMKVLTVRLWNFLQTNIGTKAAPKILVKLTIGVNFTKILKTAILCKSILHSYSPIAVWLLNFFVNRLLAHKMLVKCW